LERPEQPRNFFPLRGALIGFGNAAVHSHLSAWQKNSHFRIDAILEPSACQARLAAELLPEIPVYADLGPLLGRHDLDFLDICAPPCFHADFLLAACRAGLHVLCEKPLVTSVESLIAVRRSAAECGRVIFAVNNWKHAPLWVKTAQLIREDAIGAVQSISLTVLRPPHSGGGVSNWRRCPEIAGGGVLLDHGWHHLYLILFLLQEIPRFISARMEGLQVQGSPFLEETVDLTMRFAAAEADLHLTWRASSRRNFGIIRGSRGVISLEDDHLLLHPGNRLPRRYDFPEALSASSRHAEWMGPVLENFCGEIRDPSLRGANWKEAARCVHLIHLAYESHRRGSCFIAVGEPPA
jgi:predicted dehydrogenase